MFYGIILISQTLNTFIQLSAKKWMQTSLRQIFYFLLPFSTNQMFFIWTFPDIKLLILKNLSWIFYFVFYRNTIIVNAKTNISVGGHVNYVFENVLTDRSIQNYKCNLIFNEFPPLCLYADFARQILKSYGKQ